jgi:hypothetical protein
MIEEVQRPELTIPKKEQHDRRRPPARHGEKGEREEEFAETMEKEIVVEIGKSPADDRRPTAGEGREQEQPTEEPAADSPEEPSAMLEKMARGIDIVI